MIKLALNMIVRNESARIVRALDSVAPFVTAAVIVDTGSTDNTKQIITDYCAAHRLDLRLDEAPFVDWSQARNVALHAGRSYCRANKIDYLLLMDADMELKVHDVISFLGQQGGPSYDMYQHAGAVHYQNRRMVRADTIGVYKGVTHEYLNVDSTGLIPESVAYFIDHADGANRPEKFKRDIKLLRQGIKDEPSNERYFFYLAQSYRDAGLPHKALDWYRRRVEAGGWDEEVWQAQVNLAHCYLAMKDEGEFIRNMLIAYNTRPSRAEPLYDLANWYRNKGMNAAAVLVAETANAIPKSKDALFVNDFVYEAGVKEELSICSFYVPGKRESGFRITDHLSLQAGPYGGSRELARSNMYFYLPTLKEVCPSFVWKRIDFTPPEGWAAMNPSVTRQGDKLRAVIRTVNYKMDDQGRYLIRGTDGTANATNPIKTRNYLAALDTHLDAALCQEILPPQNWPCEFPLVVGFEDMRLFEWRRELWTSSTVRQLHADGNCEQVLARIDPGVPFQVTTYERMLRLPRGTEKNWAPIVQGDTLRFMWRLGEVVGTDGATRSKHDTGMATDHISGGSQVIPFEDGWLSIVHEARHLPGRTLRYYYHRFAFFTADFRLKQLSRPFVFNDKVIEFCAGLCWHPDNDRLVISYGFRDAEARIATIDHKEVSALLWFKSK